MRKDTPQRRIDTPTPYVGGGAIIGASTASDLAPAIPTNLLPPDTPEIGAKFVAYSAGTSTAVVNLSWDMAQADLQPVDFVVQWSLSGSFTNPTTRRVGGVRTDAAVDGLPCGVVVYFRVAAIYPGNVQGPWSGTASTTTDTDPTPPAAPTSLNTSWSGRNGDLTISWVNPGSANLKNVRLRIYASNGGALLREVDSTAGRYVWTVAQQYSDTSGTFDTAVYLVLTARSTSNVLSTTDLTGTATLSAPSAPSGLSSSWAGDGGTAGADILITWTVSGAVADYELTIDGGTPRRVGVSGRYVYPYSVNQADHSGTADPVLSLSLKAVDALGQLSTASTATATNAAPAAATASASGTFAQLAIVITPSTALDLKHYRIRTYLNGSGTPTDTIVTTSLTYFYEPPSTGSWRVDVAAVDLFGQTGTASGLTTAQALQSVAEFVANLRSRVVYSDSIGTAAVDMTGLKDGDLTTNAVIYLTSASAYRWTMADRQLLGRHRSTTLASSTTTSTYYYATSQDGVTWSWWSGGTATGGVWSPVSQASEAAAAAAAVTLAATIWRVDLPVLIEARYFKLYHRNTTGGYALREFYPREIVEADDIAAEAVTTVKLAASAVTADKINVTTLSAITGNMGTLTAGSITGGTITGVTITGATIQTSGSDPRTILDANGLTLTSQSSATYSQQTAITWKDGSVKGVYLRGYHSTNYRFLDISAAPDAEASHAGNVTITAHGYAGEAIALLQVQGAQSGGGLSSAILQADVITIDGSTTVDGTLGVSGNATVTGVLSVAEASASDVTLSNATTNAIDTVLSIVHNSTGTPAANFGGQIRFGLETTTTVNTLAGSIACFWSTATHASRTGVVAISAVDSAGAREGFRVEASGSAPKIGFFGAAAAVKPTVTGSRSSNAALASLLTALAGLGILTDSSS